jgi:NADH-quinone oxidoreductase subunit L
MRLPMAMLAVLSLVGGLVAVPGLIDVLEKFLHPAFEDSRHIEDKPSDAAQYVGLAVGAAIALAGVALAWLVYVRRPGLAATARERFPRVHDFLANKWYFDEAYDRLFVRPVSAFGDYGRSVVESAFVQRTIVGGASEIVRTGTVFARSIQSGYLRAYALLLLAGVSGLALYFLIASS